MRQCEECGAEFESSGKKRFCRPRCANTNRARARRWKVVNEKFAAGVYSTTCLCCSQPIVWPKKRFCGRACKNKYNLANLYGDQYTNKCRSKDARSFLKNLLTYAHRHETLPLEFLEDLYEKQDGRCAISNVEMTYIKGSGKIQTNISIDRIDSSRGYEIGNVQLVCCFVNTMKMAATQEELLWWCQKIIDNARKA